MLDADFLPSMQSVKYSDTLSYNYICRLLPLPFAVSKTADWETNSLYPDQMLSCGVSLYFHRLIWVYTVVPHSAVLDTTTLSFWITIRMR